MDAKSCQIIGDHVGDCRRKSARKLWANIPKASRQQATFYTDQYVVYVGVIPAAQREPIGKLARKTHHIERFNNTLRQRVSRLVRRALSFSKKLDNHIGAIKYFILNCKILKYKAYTDNYMDITTLVRVRWHPSKAWRGHEADGVNRLRATFGIATPTAGPQGSTTRAR